MEWNLFRLGRRPEEDSNLLIVYEEVLFVKGEATCVVRRIETGKYEHGYIQLYDGMESIPESEINYHKYFDSEGNNEDMLFIRLIAWAYISELGIDFDWESVK